MGFKMIIEHFLFLYTRAVFPPQQLMLDWRKVFPFLFFAPFNGTATQMLRAQAKICITLQCHDFLLVHDITVLPCKCLIT